MKTQLSSRNLLAQGFSLVEMLTVIAVIGIIAAIAIPSIGNVTSSASDAVAKRNAQNLASVFQTGKAAGVFTSANLDAAVTDVTTGASGFKVGGLSAGDITAAKAKLAWDASAGLVYNP